jgi:hypothetical protein
MPSEPLVTYGLTTPNSTSAIAWPPSGPGKYAMINASELASAPNNRGRAATMILMIGAFYNHSSRTTSVVLYTSLCLPATIISSHTVWLAILVYSSCCAAYSVKSLISPACSASGGSPTTIITTLAVLAADTAPAQATSAIGCTLQTPLTWHMRTRVHACLVHIAQACIGGALKVHQRYAGVVRVPQLYRHRNIVAVVHKIGARHTIHALQFVAHHHTTFAMPWNTDVPYGNSVSAAPCQWILQPPLWQLGLCAHGPTNKILMLDVLDSGSKLSEAVR